MKLLSFEAVTLPGAGRPRLAEVSFALEAGECAFLIGPNGAGKSSLLRLALGLERPNAGAVMLAGRAVTELTPVERAAKVAWLPQQLSFEQALTAREVVAIARYRFLESQERALDKASEWLERVGALALAQRRVTELSGGEQQRVKLATLLAQEAPLLLLDEPANHLDPAQELEVYQLLRQQWQRGLSVLCVTHDINLVSVVGDPERVRLLGVMAGKLRFDTHAADPALAERLSDLYGVAFTEVVQRGSEEQAAKGRARIFVPARLSASDGKEPT